ncbi:Cut9-interacting protein scn1 [Coemansia nantahalensis]|uniref:Cut9-interacting protein scn1 n=2 Tax=Coemansia TaxID=4863 RepID=A0ACC1LGR0_9FUNG|nr:Cut9-interacting protein scn1 [Coemansia nantahalensis]KAJ2808162.1 Cut9-interacting protein scn1 [Coemansia helicoidea]
MVQDPSVSPRVHSGHNASAVVDYDVHCHIHETPEALGVLDEPDAPQHRTVFCVQATKYTDWGDVIQLGKRYPGRVLPAVGLHPWFVEGVQSGEVPATWAAELRGLLVQHGCALGECGLDKVARNPATGRQYPLDLQLRVFEEQLAIAHEVGVPVSVHCVQAFGLLADALRGAEQRRALPPRIMLHSYSGAPDMLRQIFFRGELGKRVFVSFSAMVNGRNRQKSMECIRAAPAERLLVESDLSRADTAAEALDAVVGLVAEARGWTMPEARSTLASNARLFFGDSADC